MFPARRLPELLLISFLAAARLQAQADPIPNWSAPPHWMPQAVPAAFAKESPAASLAPEAIDVIEAVPTAPLAFTGINPCRVADTRGNGFSGQYGPPKITPAGRTITIANVCGIPTAAQAVSFNFSAVNVPGAGFLVAYPAGGAFPASATMTYNENTPTLSNAAVVPLGTAGAITVVAGVVSIDLVIDVTGYYAPQTVVNTVNGLSGSVTLAAGTNVSITPSGNTLTIASSGGGASGWSLTGNSGTTAGTNFLGTTDNQALHFKVNGQRILQLDTAGNVIGGFSSNHVDAEVVGGFIGGGLSNVVTGSYGVVGGGAANSAGLYGMVPGGFSNTAGEAAFAAGEYAYASHPGSFVWNDESGYPLSSTVANQFLARATGGFVLLRSIGDPHGTGAALQVEHGGTNGEAGWLYTTNPTTTADVVRALKYPTATNNFFRCTNYDGATVTNKCHIDANGAFTAGSDFAEALPARGGRAGFEPGDVLVASREVPGEVEKSSRRYDTRAIGVYSTRPGFLGADKNGETRVDPDDIPVAITGIVPAKVTSENGPIEPGDLLTTSSTPGYAMKATPVSVAGVEIYPAGTILGKALTPLTGKKGKIRMLALPR